MKRIRIQPSVLPDLLKPLPWTIREDGDVEDQDVWKGDPVALVGFQARFDVQTIDLLVKEWMDDPQRAVGMYPVFVEHSDGDSKTYVYQVAVEEVQVLPDAPCEVVTLLDGVEIGRYYAMCTTHDCVQGDAHTDAGAALRAFACDGGRLWRFVVENDPDGPPHMVDLSRLKEVVRSAQEHAVHNDDAHLRVWRWTGDGGAEELVVAHVPGTGAWVETGDHHDRGPMAYPQFTVTGPDDTEYVRVTITVDGAA